jgi:hypothetical protein
MKGAINQLDIIVRIIGLGFLPNFFNSDTCKFNIAGYIIRNREIPIGIDIWPILKEIMASLILGIIKEKRIPITMHNATQSVRYLSNMLIDLPSSSLIMHHVIFS